MKELKCIKCGNERDKGRKLCKKCYLEYKRNKYAQNGRHNYGISNCITCGKEILLWKKDQLQCYNCSRIHYKKNITNDYERGKGKRYSFLHRRIAEEILNRKLNSNEIVHHLDDNHLNNDKSNLVIISRSVHGKIHAYMKKQRLIVKDIIDRNGEIYWQKYISLMCLFWLKINNIEYIKL